MSQRSAAGGGENRDQRRGGANASSAGGGAPQTQQQRQAGMGLTPVGQLSVCFQREVSFTRGRVVFSALHKPCDRLSRVASLFERTHPTGICARARVALAPSFPRACRESLCFPAVRQVLPCLEPKGDQLTCSCMPT